MSVSIRPTSATARSLATFAAGLAAALLLAACGGGGDVPGSAAAPTEQPAAYNAGPISGLGSIIVNGVRFDDSSAAVSDEDSVSRSRSELRLGMMVEVDSARVDRSNASGRASHIRMGSSVVGPVQAVNAAAGTLTVLGQAVVVSATTVFGDGLSGGLAMLAVGTVLDVHGQWDASAKVVQATRLEVKTGVPAYRLRGSIANLDATAKTFNIGAAVVNYASAGMPAGLPALADGQRVRVLLQTAPVAGQWVATALRTAAPKLDDRAEAHLRGSVTAFTSSTLFSVNDTPVNASGASFPDGTAGLVLGARVEVEGALSNGVLVASKVELDDRHAGERHRIELHGAITSADAVNKTFVLRGITVSHAGAVAFERGTAAGLVVGAQVEVKGVPGAGSSTLVATRIKFE